MEEIFLIKYLKDSSCKNNLEYTINGKLFSYLRSFIWILFYFIFEYSHLRFGPSFANHWSINFGNFWEKPKFSFCLIPSCGRITARNGHDISERDFDVDSTAAFSLVKQYILPHGQWSLYFSNFFILFYFILFLNFLLILTAKHI